MPETRNDQQKDAKSDAKDSPSPNKGKGSGPGSAGPGGGDGNMRFSRSMLGWILILAIAILIFVFFHSPNSPTPITYSQFLKHLEQGHIKQVVVREDGSNYYTLTGDPQDTVLNQPPNSKWMTRVPLSRTGWRRLGSPHSQSPGTRRHRN